MPAHLRETIVPGVRYWSRPQPDRDSDLNSFFVEQTDGNFVVDPLEPDDETLAELRARGVALIIVTNRDHERASASLADALGAPVYASRPESELFARTPEFTIETSEKVFGWDVVGLFGLKTPYEIALVDRKRKAAIVGRALRGTPAARSRSRRRSRTSRELRARCATCASPTLSISWSARERASSGTRTTRSAQRSTPPRACS